MWSFIVQNIILSVLVIMLVQYLWDYFKPTNYSRKTRDIVDFQTKKYREILKDIQESQTAHPAIHNDEYLSAEEKDRMVSELLSFIEVGEK